MNVLSFVVCSVALVPAPRELHVGEGTYVVEPKVKYTLVHWYDFDRVGQAFAEMKKTVTTDAMLPKEGYRLKVTKAGAEIAAADAAGEFYAMQTLRQLAVTGGTNTVSISCCEVKDWPAYRWRGFMIDEGRRFLGKETVLKVLDTMTAHKLNLLHWHLTEDQGWRLELKRHPELVKYGAKRRCSVREARLRGLPLPHGGASSALAGQPCQLCAVGMR